MNLRRRDSGTALGVAPGVSLGEQAGDDEARNGQRENERY